MGRFTGAGGLLAGLVLGTCWSFLGLISSDIRQPVGLVLGVALFVSVGGALVRAKWAPGALVAGAVAHTFGTVGLLLLPAWQSWRAVPAPRPEPLTEESYGPVLTADGLVGGLAFVGLVFSLLMLSLGAALLYSALRGGVRRRVRAGR